MSKSLVRTRDGERSLLATQLDTADSLLSRTKGLLGRSTLPTGEALWIKRCNSIHTFFMRFAIDAIFVDENLKVVSVYEDLRPWRITRLHFKASSVFELPSGTLAGTLKDVKRGDHMSIENGGTNG
ncbi:DUF192 domain-containing protein [soil metagenome]